MQSKTDVTLMVSKKLATEYKKYSTGLFTEVVKLHVLLCTIINTCALLLEECGLSEPEKAVWECPITMLICLCIHSTASHTSEWLRIYHT